MRKSAEVTVVPKRDQMTIPKPISTAAAMKVPMAPRLLIHFPTPRPTMLNRVSNASSASEAARAKDFVVGKSLRGRDLAHRPRRRRSRA